jgi:hypothetical protein
MATPPQMKKKLPPWMQGKGNANSGVSRFINKGQNQNQSDSNDSEKGIRGAAGRRLKAIQKQSNPS